MKIITELECKKRYGIIVGGGGVAEVEIAALQNRLEKDDHIMIHFPDELIPEDRERVEKGFDEGHL